jgi:Rps23 Pro-64 3,4-dihydroxylase Tpa1-like proline 4-hydroxylase
MIQRDIIDNIDVYARDFAQASPFSHSYFQRFFDEDQLRAVKAELATYNSWFYDPDEYVAGHQVNKFFTPAPKGMGFEESIDYMKSHAPNTYSVLLYLQSEPVLKFLERLTGINNLVADGDWLGGGVHRITTGGKLDIHADFNIHWIQKTLHRRLNLLLYLNDPWLPEWEGNLELWSTDRTYCARVLPPVFNSCAIFRITDTAFHGHPIPLNTPPGIDRLSLALYYYTIDRPEEEKSASHPVLW